MKIQELAIIFVIIILPISLLLSEYTQAQIQTISLQTEYDTKLTTATYDAIRAFQLNTTNSSTADLSNSKLRDLDASINAFRNSLKTGFSLNGYTDEELNNYIPALVYTLYDGFYIYSPYENIVDNEGNLLEETDEKQSIYGLKPYISYSCRYKKGSLIDVVITYSLDNYITVQGMINSEYVNKGGYLIEDIEVLANGKITYNGVEIKKEHLKEKIGDKLYSYIKINGTKYYLIKNDADPTKNYIGYLLNGKMAVHSSDPKVVTAWEILIEDKNNTAQVYYKKAYEFTEWFKNTGLKQLTYSDAYDVIIKEDGTTQSDKIWTNDSRLIFEFDASTNIENQLSSFNQHRLAVIRHKIETNLSIAISNYNEYSSAATNNVFQMPELKENEWDHITNNISIISFLQGLHIGGKVYNGYSLVTNSESKEVVPEENIYILGNDNNYHRIGDKELEVGGSVEVNASQYAIYDSGDEHVSAGRLNLDFNRNVLSNSDTSAYYYSLKDYNASYDSVVMQNNVTTYEDIYAYVDEQLKEKGNTDLAQAFYTALGRERECMYREENEVVDQYSVLIVASTAEVYTNTSVEKQYTEITKQITKQLNEEKGTNVRYLHSNDKSYVNDFVTKNSDKYHLIIVNSYVWTPIISNEVVNKLAEKTNIFTISNDSNSALTIIDSSTTQIEGLVSTPSITQYATDILGDATLNKSDIDWQCKIRFVEGTEIFYTTTYNDDGNNEIYDLIGCKDNGTYKWVHAQYFLDNNYSNHMYIIKKLVKYAMKDEI